MKKVRFSVASLVIPTYPEPPAEDLPMFAENRVHQRSSGRPYPNKVVMQVCREEKIDRAYTVVTLENEFVKLEILPEIGGRIYSALDKTTGYDFFYKQHVIKPALIGVLGSWISGGVEFNWPFHHRASGFLPCDFTVEEYPDGSVACHLSEHDPIDRMKGMVSVILRPGESSFETRMRLYNRTPDRRSFLWWENAAVPVNESYQIFFPADVSYVNFHYLKSRISYPIAGDGVFNGIPMQEDRDISMHKNTREATSYFACASDFDFFGGYDHGKACGVVHIGDHHVSPGKKMFTWAYGQLARSWERALTDTDGQYAELMAGSYSDNQPNFSWLAPYETKEFSQHWYPITKIGTPSFANLACALRIDREAGALHLQSTRCAKDARVTVTAGGKTLLDEVCTLSPDAPLSFPVCELPRFVTVTVEANGEELAVYEEREYDRHAMPPVITDTPAPAELQTTRELYLAGTHVDQYRDPAVECDAYFLEALRRDAKHIPSLVAMADYALRHLSLAEAEEYARRAISALGAFNERHESGDAYYVLGKILEAQGRDKEAYDAYRKAAWAADAVAKAMTRAAVLSLKKGDAHGAKRDAAQALDYGRKNALALAVSYLAESRLGNEKEAARIAKETLAADPLDHLMRFLSGEGDFYAPLDSNPQESCLDLCFDLLAMGETARARALLSGLVNARPDAACKMTYYVLASLTEEETEAAALHTKAQAAPLGKAYPHRAGELAILSSLATENEEARMLAGCILYHNRHYAEAAALWEAGADPTSRRNLAVAYFSHLDRADDAYRLMRALCEKYPLDEELLYECVCLADKMGVAPEEKVALIRAHTTTRDDVLTELAKALNQAGEYDEALTVLLSHAFVPCEGGEHAIADQYMYAYLCKGKAALDAGDAQGALSHFLAGQTLPESLGAGIWNHCKRIPLRYHEALCLEALGRTEEAHAIYRYIRDTEIEYFSNMHLKELPYYQACASRRLGEGTHADRLVTAYGRAWDKIKDGSSGGFFGTTPFFIPFVDGAAKCRRAQHLYLTAFIDAYRGDAVTAREKMRESASLVSDNHFAHFFAKYGFLH